MLKIKQKRISQQEKDELAEMLYSISEEEEREVSRMYSCNRSAEFEESPGVFYFE